MAETPDPIVATLQIQGSPANPSNFAVQMTTRLLPSPAAGETLAVAVSAGFEELIVYAVGHVALAPSDECLYLYGKATATLPSPDVGTFYVAVDLLNARANMGVMNVRGLIASYVDMMRAKIPGVAPHPGGTGPVSSHP